MSGTARAADGGEQVGRLRVVGECERRHADEQRDQAKWNGPRRRLRRRIVSRVPSWIARCDRPSARRTSPTSRTASSATRSSEGLRAQPPSPVGGGARMRPSCPGRPGSALVAAASSADPDTPSPRVRLPGRPLEQGSAEAPRAPRQTVGHVRAHRERARERSTQHVNDCGSRTVIRAAHSRRR
jgi:hypothetical protein